MSPAPSNPLRASRRFDILARIGAGGMSVVYDAWDKERNARVAIKTLPGLDPRALYRFKNEFRFLTDVSHRNLATLYELFFEEDQCFFSMEYVPGGHFLDYVRPHGVPVPLNPEDPTVEFGNTSPQAWQAPGRRPVAPGVCDTDRLTTCLIQLTRAVMALHEARILHRDLKPLNVKVTPEGRVVVLDFGLAAHTTAAQFDSGSRTDIVGTVAYMSPEQSSGGDVSEATDWYAVGVMVYEALTGRLPFEGNATDILLAKRQREATLASVHAEVSEMWDAVCAGLLARDPALRLSGDALLTLLQQGLSAVHTRPEAPTASLRAERIFVGRETQLALLREAFAANAPNVPSLVFVRGKSGIGKSSLIERFLKDVAVDSNVVTLVGRCYERESMPYKAFDNVIDSLARYMQALPRHEAAELTPRAASALAQVFPVLRRVPAIAAAPQATQALEQHELRRKAFAALRELLARLSDRRRVAIWIDDLQWGDVDSAALLREVLTPPDAPAFLFIGSYRSEYENRSPALAALLAAVPRGPGLDFRDVLVGPLNQEETLLLARRLLLNRAHGRAEEIARDSEGSPYLLQEIASVSNVGAAPALLTLDAVLSERIAALPEDSRRLLGTVAVSVRPLAEKQALRASGIAANDPGLLVALRSARLIRGAGAEIEPYHDRVRETVLAHLEPAALAECHRRLAGILEADAEAAAVHFEGAGEPDKASRYYADAAERASAALAFKNAAELYQRALHLSRLTGEPRRRLIVRLAEALGNAGRGPEAARAYREAARGAHAPEIFHLERSEARWFATTGHMDEGRESLQKVLRRVDVRIPSRSWLMAAIAFHETRLMFRGLKLRPLPEDRIPPPQLERIDTLWDAMLSFGMVDVFTGVYLGVRGTILALRAGERRRIARSLALAVAGLAGLDWNFARVRAARMTALCASLNDEEKLPYLEGMLSIAEGFTGFGAGRFAEGLRGLQHAERIFSEECVGVAWELATARIFSLWMLVYLGRLKELSRRAPLWMEEGEDRGDLYQAISIGAGQLPVCHLVADRPQEALDAIDSALNRWTRYTYAVQFAIGAFIRVWVHLYRGDAEAAWGSLNGEWEAIRGNHYLRLSGTRAWLLSARAQAALATGRTAHREATELEKDTSPISHALAAIVRAGCAALSGQKDEAIALLEKAVKASEDSELAMIGAAARRRLGELTGGEKGRALIEESERAMRAEGIVNPARFAAIYANGF